MLKVRPLHRKLLAWYDKEARVLPWRKNQDPYRVWISEIMLQQTRVQAVVPFYERFLRRFPSVRVLAEAPPDDVLAHWAGLGYYSRARNLQKAAQQIMQLYEGTFPSSAEELSHLAGIGPYTANAIASIAFGEAVAAIDGNLERVLARLMNLQTNPKKEGRSEISTIAQKIVELGRAGDCNQALMDVSSAFCLPKQTKCQRCPLQDHCQAYKLGTMDRVPIRLAKAKPTLLDSNALLVLQKKSTQTQVLIMRRQPKAWLAGMWDIPWTLEGEPRFPCLTSWKELGQFTLQRTITRYKIRFHVRCYLAKDTKISGKNLFQTCEFRWEDTDKSFLLPNASRRALGHALALLANPQ